MKPCSQLLHLLLCVHYIVSSLAVCLSLPLSLSLHMWKSACELSPHSRIIYVRTYVSMDGWMDGWTDGWMQSCLHHACMHVSTHTKIVDLHTVASKLFLHLYYPYLCRHKHIRIHALLCIEVRSPPAAQSRAGREMRLRSSLRV